mmetsp:Transcript_35294/g.76612  ORF Transcript_35294/g.76612 Transcript_35294/m.76612 type:complete len:281 (-) Transcript_35294:879-1721(-)
MGARGRRGRRPFGPNGEVLVVVQPSLGLHGVHGGRWLDAEAEEVPALLGRQGLHPLEPLRALVEEGEEGPLHHDGVPRGAATQPLPQAPEVNGLQISPVLEGHRKGVPRVSVVVLVEENVPVAELAGLPLVPRARKQRQQHVAPNRLQLDVLDVQLPKEVRAQVRHAQVAVEQRQRQKHRRVVRRERHARLKASDHVQHALLQVGRPGLVAFLLLHGPLGSQPNHLGDEDHQRVRDRVLPLVEALVEGRALGEEGGGARQAGLQRNVERGEGDQEEELQL